MNRAVSAVPRGQQVVGVSPSDARAVATVSAPRPRRRLEESRLPRSRIGLVDRCLGLGLGSEGLVHIAVLYTTKDCMS